MTPRRRLRYDPSVEHYVGPPPSRFSVDKAKATVALVAALLGAIGGIVGTYLSTFKDHESRLLYLEVRIGNQPVLPAGPEP